MTNNLAAELHHEQIVDPTAWVAWGVPLLFALALAMLIAIRQVRASRRR